MSSGSDHYAYCQDCDWYATPEEHDYADVNADADVHATFHSAHTVTQGVSEYVREEAELRSIEAGTGDSTGGSDDV